MLEIDFIGYDGTHPNGFIYGLPNGHDSYLLLLTATPVEFLLADGIEFHGEFFVRHSHKLVFFWLHPYSSK